MTFCDSIICYLQYLFGLAHVMKLPLFRQACELAFAERKAVGNDCILEHEVYCYLPLFASLISTSNKYLNSDLHNLNF